MNIRVLALAASLALALPALAEDSTTYPTDSGTLTVNSGQPAPHPEGHILPNSLAELDQDGDGVLTESEASANLAVVNDFIHIDLNDDRRISESELDRYLAGNMDDMDL